MDRYFIINNYDRAIPKAGVRPQIGIYDKWHEANGGIVPEKINPGAPDQTEKGQD